MMIKAFICLVFGVFLLAAPGLLLKILGATTDAGGLFTGREYGAALIGNLLLTWFARNAGKSSARRAIILNLFVYDAIGFVVVVANVVTGVLNPLGWGIALMYLFFTLGYGYFWFVKEPGTNMAPQAQTMTR
jgi:hypothetical protein